ncbi:protein S100-B-like [Tachysurus fulvidraco]|uniref:protein S100-B-like n=1 Tax=Tachysurus fulvidraco TaxID=1234273 RepID=UPI000F4F1F82|nr:protein S100-B-like [Tachysurus fulvidraco]
MSKLEKAIVAIVEVFEECAGTDEDKRKLSNAELGTLIKSQLSSPEFRDKVDQEAVKEALEGIDKNRDGQVSFKEFSQCIAKLSDGYFIKKYGKEKGKGKHH